MTNPTSESAKPVALTFDAFRQANVTRCVKWHPLGIGSWSASDWMTAIVGELGEAASLLKMRNRERDNLPGNKFSPTDKQIADELADVLTYLDLLAAMLGIDLGKAAVSKFNEISERVGFPDRITLAASSHPQAPSATSANAEVLSLMRARDEARKDHFAALEACDVLRQKHNDAVSELNAELDCISFICKEFGAKENETFYDFVQRLADDGEGRLLEIGRLLAKLDVVKTEIARLVADVVLLKERNDDLEKILARLFDMTAVRFPSKEPKAE